MYTQWALRWEGRRRREKKNRWVATSVAAIKAFSSGCASRASTRHGAQQSRQCICAAVQQEVSRQMADVAQQVDRPISDDDEDDVLFNTGQQSSVRFQRHRNAAQQQGHHSIRPLINSQLLQHPHHRLSRTSLLSSCKSMDFGYADER